MVHLHVLINGQALMFGNLRMNHLAIQRYLEVSEALLLEMPLPSMVMLTYSDNYFL